MCIVMCAKGARLQRNCLSREHRAIKATAFIWVHQVHFGGPQPQTLRWQNTYTQGHTHTMAAFLAHRSGMGRCPAARSSKAQPFSAPRPAVQLPSSCSPSAAARTAPVAHNNWRTFGPTAEHSDGDAEYYQLTNRLAQQHEWFAPREQDDGAAPGSSQPGNVATSIEDPGFGLSERQIRALGLTGPQSNMPDPVSMDGGATHLLWRCHRHGLLTPRVPVASVVLQKTLSSKAYMRGEKMNPEEFGFNVTNMAGSRGRSYSPTRAAYGDYPNYPEGRPIFLPEAERFGNPPDLPSLLLQQRVIYISMPVRGESGRCSAWKISGRTCTCATPLCDAGRTCRRGTLIIGTCCMRPLLPCPHCGRPRSLCRR